MRKLFLSLAVLVSVCLWADEKTVSSPDGRLVVTVSCNDGNAMYAVSYDGKQLLKRKYQNFAKARLVRYAIS